MRAALIDLPAEPMMLHLQKALANMARRRRALAFATSLALHCLVGCPRTHVRGRDAGPVVGEPCGDVICPDGL
jgi:hypothetical protein